MAEEGHYGGRPGSSRQGIYVCSPSGKFLASINSNNPDRVLRMMQQGLDRWRGLVAEDRTLADDAKIKPKHRWEDSYPVGGLVLNMFTRDLPATGGPNQARASKWNQDPVWFSKSEARQWLPEVLEINAEYSPPQSLTSRLARMHLVDMVKGQTDTFSKSELRNVDIKVKVVEFDETQARIELAGHTHAESTRRSRRTSAHGVKTELKGTASFDLMDSRFTEFELVAVGTRWGYTRFNGRRRDPDESRIGFVFRLADPAAPRIAPAFVHQYEADWIKRP